MTGVLCVRVAYVYRVRRDARGCLWACPLCDSVPCGLYTRMGVFPVLVGAEPWPVCVACAEGRSPGLWAPGVRPGCDLRGLSPWPAWLQVLLWSCMHEGQGSQGQGDEQTDPGQRAEGRAGGQQGAWYHVPSSAASAQHRSPRAPLLIIPSCSQPVHKEWVQDPPTPASGLENRSWQGQGAGVLPGK